MAECTDTEQLLISATLKGDANEIELLKSQIAYERLPEELRTQYRKRYLELEDANAALNKVIEQIPNLCRGKVIERLKREAREERAAANYSSNATAPH